MNRPLLKICTLACACGILTCAGESWGQTPPAAPPPAAEAPVAPPAAPVEILGADVVLKPEPGWSMAQPNVVAMAKRVILPRMESDSTRVEFRAGLVRGDQTKFNVFTSEFLMCVELAEIKGAQDFLIRRKRLRDNLSNVAGQRFREVFRDVKISEVTFDDVAGFPTATLTAGGFGGLQFTFHGWWIVLNETSLAIFCNVSGPDQAKIIAETRRMMASLVISDSLKLPADELAELKAGLLLPAEGAAGQKSPFQKLWDLSQVEIARSNHARAAELLEQAAGEARKMLDQGDGTKTERTAQLISAWKVASGQWRAAGNPERALSAARRGLDEGAPLAKTSGGWANSELGWCWTGLVESLVALGKKDDAVGECRKMAAWVREIAGPQAEMLDHQVSTISALRVASRALRNPPVKDAAEEEKHLRACLEMADNFPAQSRTQSGVQDCRYTVRIHLVELFREVKRWEEAQKFARECADIALEALPSTQSNGPDWPYRMLEASEHQIAILKANAGAEAQIQAIAERCHQAVDSAARQAGRMQNAWALVRACELKAAAGEKAGKKPDILAMLRDGLQLLQPPAGEKAKQSSAWHDYARQIKALADGLARYGDKSGALEQMRRAAEASVRAVGDNAPAAAWNDRQDIHARIYELAGASIPPAQIADVLRIRLECARIFLEKDKQSTMARKNLAMSLAGWVEFSEKNPGLLAKDDSELNAARREARDLLEPLVRENNPIIQPHHRDILRRLEQSLDGRK